MESCSSKNRLMLTPAFGAEARVDHNNIKRHRSVTEAVLLQ